MYLTYSLSEIDQKIRKNPKILTANLETDFSKTAEK